MKLAATLLLVLITFALSRPALANNGGIKMNFKNQDLLVVIDHYAKATGQKFVVDPSVRGKITLIVPEVVSKEEAFNQLSSALAVNGYGISKQGDTMVIRTARNVQRDLIEVGREKPSLKPERMFTWIYTPKFVSVGSINRDLRLLVSKDGEMSVVEDSNQLIITDWVSNLNRVYDIIAAFDKPLDPATARIVETQKKARASTESPK